MGSLWENQQQVAIGMSVVWNVLHSFQQGGKWSILHTAHGEMNRKLVWAPPPEAARLWLQLTVFSLHITVVCIHHASAHEPSLKPRCFTVQWQLYGHSHHQHGIHPENEKASTSATMSIVISVEKNENHNIRIVIIRNRSASVYMKPLNYFL